MAALTSLSFFAILPFSASAQTLTLSDHSNQIAISPQDLSIRWNDLVINSPSLSVNEQAQTISRLTVDSPTKAHWVLQPSKLRVNAVLKEQALELSFAVPKKTKIKRNQPIVLRWFDLPQKCTDTLYLPFSEGMRIPVDNKMWANYLTENHSGANTTQDLKMPFWTVQQGKKTISYQLVNATNNSLTFSNTMPKVDMLADHRFTTLNKNQAFKVRITLGDNWMDGAKAYKQWRIDHHQSTTLAEKAQQTPQLARLIGASQVYLFGKTLISTDDVTDWWGLKNWYFSQDDLTQPQAAIQEIKPLTKGRDWLSRYHKQLLVDSLNASLQLKFLAPAPSQNNNAIAEQYQAAQRQKHWLLQNASQYLISPERWGQALSLDMLDNMKKAGLTKLWLGFDNWMPAFYQPQAIDAAKQLGYLVATYDSYNTAIPKGLNDGWLTAQLPDQMREQCAIEQANGEKKTGFRGNGYYLNPNCELDYVKQRVEDIIQYGRFNSLFLDVDATAMAREDYRDNSSESDMLNAFNQRMNWIAKQGNLVLGSEDGNSLTTTGIAFAHGLETVGFGWTDKEMKHDQHSPYFLGRWYPDQKPEFFFKSAQVKEPYKTLLFSPQFRVPLYQAVFHDEVINSHHWHSDSLKFTNVQAERDLISMLYNTPPMVHLTRDEANSPDSPRLKALAHYQQAYTPIHEQLWDKPLTSFKWLDKSGQVQQTSFSDGSTITANFGSKSIENSGVKIAPHSILAQLSNGRQIHWQAHHP
ncbi:glycoside hydrolase [Vibrio sp. Isolate24]|uniref:glycoside hydrolase n=1 Tax=Vibrio sp. Isolate24 TaxID=2908534 RepID=UPI001EFEF06A|nr:glycoside hydrolase [Vibrio sp. Isolate24]MCG9677591.1 glycoside hydrolase [Vibrio sp. Isolate24]